MIRLFNMSASVLLALVVIFALSNIVILLSGVEIVGGDNAFALPECVLSTWNAYVCDNQNIKQLSFYDHYSNNKLYVLAVLLTGLVLTMLFLRSYISYLTVILLLGVAILTVLIDLFAQGAVFSYVSESYLDSNMGLINKITYGIFIISMALSVIRKLDYKSLLSVIAVFILIFLYNYFSYIYLYSMSNMLGGGFYTLLVYLILGFVPFVLNICMLSNSVMHQKDI